MLVSRLSALPQTPACSRCFHTDAHGRIALRRDWPLLFSALGAWDEVIIQSRHTYARLIHLGRLPEMVWDATGLVGRDEAGALQFRFDRWGEAWGRLELCACCESPGHIEINNARGGDILQLRPAACTPPAIWAACLDQLAEARPALDASCKLVGFPLLPAGFRAVRETAVVLPAFLTALGRDEAVVRFLLRTPEVVHLREFIPLHTATDYPLLVTSDGRTTLQLALPPVLGLALAVDHSLHLSGPGGSLLLSLAPGAGHQTSWCAALNACFPSLRSTSRE